MPRLNEMAHTVSVTKIVKQGFGRKINSEFGYSSFDIQPTTIEVHVDPPIDLTTEEGREAFRKLQESLTKMTGQLLEKDVEHYASRNEELRRTLAKKALLLEKIAEAD